MSYSTGLRNDSPTEGVVCRLCMKSNDRTLNIFISIGDSGVAAWNVMEELLNVQVNEDDGLPDIVCHKCVGKLMKFRDFKDMCLKSEIELRKVTRCSNLKNNVKEEVDPGGSENWIQQNNDEDELPEGRADNVICVPVTAVDLVDVKQEVDISESHYEGETYEEENDNRDEYQEEDNPFEESMPLEVDVKQEVDISEPHYEGETYEEENDDGDENQGEEDPFEESISLEMNNEVYENSVSREFPKTNGIMKDISVESLGNGVNEIKRSVIPRGHTLRNDSSGQLESTLSEHSSLTDGDANAFRREICFNWKSNLMIHSIFSAGAHWVGYSSERNPVRCRSLKAKRIFFCDECGEGCPTKKQLKKHSAIHSRRYKCEVCGKEYLLLKKLNKHSKMHLRPFKCEICGIGFNVKNHLLIHQRIHTGVKPFKCKCGKEFSSKGSLGKHSRFYCNAGT